MRQILLLAIIMALASSSINSQIVTTEEIEEKAEQKVDQRVDKKIDEGLDKSLNGLEKLLFGKKKKKNKKENKDKKSETEDVNEDEQSSGNDYSGLSNLFGGDADIEDSYAFDTETEVVITTTEKKGKKPDVMTYNILFPNTGSHFAMELKDMESKEDVPPTIVIFDFNKYQMVNLVESDGQKMAMVIKLDEEEFNDKMNENIEENEDNVSIRKTGRSKIIQGYQCDEYATKTEDGEGNFWITKDSDLRIGMAMGSMAASQGTGSGMGSSGQGGFPVPANMPQGAVLEMDFVENDGSTMKWETTNINTNANRSFETGDYTIMNLGSGMGR